MKKEQFLWVSLFFLIYSCSQNTISEQENKKTCNGLCFSTDFESGSIGKVTRISQDVWSLDLKNDNSNSSLPDSYRTWWNVKIEYIPSSGAKLRFTKLGFPYYFVPVFSTNGKDWKHFPESAVKQIDPATIEVSLSGDQSSLWIARTFPYTTKDYKEYRDSIAVNPNVKISSLGNSPFKNTSIELLTITNTNQNPDKKTIWIHARTHAAEVGSSYVLEGLINTILSESSLGADLRQKYIFKIVPMHNPDGIILGNYRTNGSSTNLEGQWLFDKTTLNPIYLQDSAPVENKFLNKNAMSAVVVDQVHPVVLALNLHSSNSDINTPAFFFPHFGPGNNYDSRQQNLWNKQINFIQTVASFYNGRIEAPPTDGGNNFLNTYFPETWFWYNKRDLVNAITLETTYSKAGYDYWVTPKEWKQLGVALAHAINNSNFHRANLNSNDRSMFKSPSTMTKEQLQKLEINH
ncbi:M14-type cytosolic carboxypeptidase [Chryseobacterium sp. S90]|uniref:M14-type cytosolic carboxypeptidase n=1 Tax=Chryseobacterium sp. S90 TaxID=3395373 RepID=UPI0039BD5B2C